MYEEIYNVEVVEIGVMVKKHQSWLCASSDGVVCMNGKHFRLVVFKCSNCWLWGKKMQRIDLYFYEKRRMRLKESYVYYTQVEIKMCVLGFNECD